MDFVNAGKSAGTSAGWFKLVNEIRNKKENIILWEVPVLWKVHNADDDNLVPRASHHSDMGQAQGIDDIPSPQPDIRKRYPGYKVNFMTKC